jgi:hypothetical protein
MGGTLFLDEAPLASAGLVGMGVWSTFDPEIGKKASEKEEQIR